MNKELEILKQEILTELKSQLHQNCNCSKSNIVGEFQKVSLQEFQGHFEDNLETIKDLYDNTLILPVRSSEDSAGHDFVTTKDIKLNPGESIKIPLGIRAKIEKGWVLFIVPRSGLGSKFRLQINNTIGVIDGDYYYTDNEGHIMATITNDSNDSNEGKVLKLAKGDRFLQGIFLPYGLTVKDKPLGKRTGGHGSSGV